jgi:hypothetical protein
VSSQAPALPVIHVGGGTRSRLIRRAKLANAPLGWWWLDPVIGLGIAALALKEGRDAWAGEVCADCAPVGFDNATLNTQGCDCD